VVTTACDLDRFVEKSLRSTRQKGRADGHDDVSQHNQDHGGGECPGECADTKHDTPNRNGGLTAKAVGDDAGGEFSEGHGDEEGHVDQGRL
jgi:hypothetical protein